MRDTRSLLLAIIQQIVFGAVVLLAIVYLSFFGLDMARGADFRAAIPDALSSSLDYLSSLLRGDLGMTEAGSLTLRPIPIEEVVPVAFARSLALLLASLLIAAPIGILLGIWASRGRYSGWSLLVLLASIIGVSIPSFFAALMLQLAVIEMTRTSGQSIIPVGGFGWDIHILLPALVLALRPLAQITRVTFVTLNEVLEQDYVRTAYSKGLTARLVMNRHVFRNAAVAILTTLGVSLRFSLSSLPVVEFFFGWPGLGFTMLRSISRQDDELTLALVLCLGALFILVNIILDIGYRLIDPRLRSTPEHVELGERQGLFARLVSILRDFLSWITSRPLKRWLAARNQESAPSPYRAVLEERGATSEEMVNGNQGERRTWLRATLYNLPLLLGAVIVFTILVVILFGPLLAPHSPYTTQGLTIENGEFRVPPFEPDEIYLLGTDVLGRDLMSLLLAGAQLTLLMVTVVVIARLLIGFGLGALAGWLNGRWIDRIIMGSAEIIAAIPALVLAMILILAMGIQEGLAPFVIALCFVGWGEIMQYVRGEVLKLRPKLFIESAVALGLRTPRLIAQHVLPNLIPALISIAALEMGAVLMLLGELGFVGIFIGGGAFAELDIAADPYHYSDVPEWGALLSNVRAYARAYPWTAIYPSLAFFVTILGFNLFGEGLRRMVEIVGVRVMRLFNRYTLAGAAVVLLGFVWWRGSTGSLAYYQRQARAFDGQQSLLTTAVLADEALQGRALHSAGLDIAAQYIADQFESLEIQAAGDNLTYFQSRTRSYESLDIVPRLLIADGGPALVYRQDYAERPMESRNLGAALVKVRFIALGEITAVGRMMRQYPALRDLDFSNEILLVASEKDADILQDVPHAGLLVVAEDPLDLQRRYTLSSSDPFWQIFGVGRQQGQESPTLWISAAVADRLLAQTGQSVSSLRQVAERLERDEVYELATDVTAGIEIQGTINDKVPVSHVIGHWPGLAAGGAGIAQEAQLDDQLIVVIAQYDSPPLGPEGLVYPAAIDNGTGVAVMLEAIRAMRESGYQPYKTFLFIAYSGEGFEGGEQVRPEIAKFLQTKYGFSDNFEVEAIVDLRGLGSSAGDELLLMTGGSLRLANLFEAAAQRMGVPVRREGVGVDISIVFEERSFYAGGDEAPTIGLAWEGWQNTAHMSKDTLRAVSVENLENAGRALSLGLMILGREVNY